MPPVYNAFEQCFWATATAMVNIIVPVIAIVILFKILHYFIVKGE